MNRNLIQQDSPDPTLSTIARSGYALLLLTAVLWIAPSQAFAAACIAPDSGGTAALPPSCGLESIGPFVLDAGLPPATHIDIEIVELNLVCSNPIECNGGLAPGICEELGGSLGGDRECYTSTLQLGITGQGLLAGFNRNIQLPVVDEVDTGPRTAGEPIQAFPSNYVYMQGELFGDPDFCTLRLRWGSDFGLPSPGTTILTDLGDSTWNVDSFFDIAYEIDYIGCPGSILEGFGGTGQKLGKVRRGVHIPVVENAPALSGPWAAILLTILLGTGGLWLRRSARAMP